MVLNIFFLTSHYVWGQLLEKKLLSPWTWEWTCLLLTVRLAFLSALHSHIYILYSISKKNSWDGETEIANGGKKFQSGGFFSGQELCNNLCVTLRQSSQGLLSYSCCWDFEEEDFLRKMATNIWKMMDLHPYNNKYTNGALGKLYHSKLNKRKIYKKDQN